MQQYLIHAFDGTDEGALERRMAARPAHLELARTLKANGNFIVGGAILDEQGKMIGSNVMLQFEDDAAFEAYQKQEPYIVQGVWREVNIYPARVAQI